MKTKQIKPQNFCFLLLAFSFLLTTGMNCKKDPTKNAVLPPATQEGKNTVGFILNDEVWVPYGECKTLCNKISARYGFPSAEEFGIDFQFTREREKAGKSSALTISSTLIGNITSVGEKIDSIGVSFRGENSSGNTDYYIGPLVGSKFFITKLDTANKIISGEFELILRESNSSKQIILKNGRFDFKMNACLCDSK
jgi:hypothetical protein